MKLRLPLLFAAASMGASILVSSPSFAESITLNDGQEYDMVNLNVTKDNNEYSVTSNDGGKGAWIGWSVGGTDDPKLGSNVKLLGSTNGTGIAGIFYRVGNGNKLWSTIDLTGLDASGFTGRFTVVNDWNNSSLVKLSGTSFSKTEYLFTGASREVKHDAWIHKQGGGASDRAFQTLELQGATTFAGITGASKGLGYNTVGDFSAKELLTASASGTVLTIAGSGNYLYNGRIGDDKIKLGISHTGTGTQTFTGASILDSVKVSAGTLELKGTTSASSIAISGGKLLVTGATTLSGALDLSGQGSLELGSLDILKGATGISFGGIINIGDDLALNETNPLITTAGSVTIKDGANLVFSSTGLYSGTYAILNSANSITEADLAKIKVTAPNDKTSIKLAINSGNIVALVTSDLASLNWNGGNSGTWNTKEDNKVWSSNGQNVAYTQGNKANFDSSANVTLEGKLSPAELLVEKGAKVSLIGSDSAYLTGSTKVLVSGNGSQLILSGAHDYTGRTTIEEGATLTWNIGTKDASSFATEIINNGTFEKTGTGTLSFGTSTFSGNGRFTVAEGTMKMTSFREGNYGATGDGILDLAVAGKFTQATSFAGDGQIKFSNSSNYVIATQAGTGDFKGTVFVTAGEVKWGENGTGAAVAGERKSFGEQIVIESGKKLALALWTVTPATTSEPADRVEVATNIFIKNSTLEISDGSYYFSKGLTVSGTSVFTCNWAKGFVINGINGDEGGTFTLERRAGEPTGYNTFYRISGAGTYNGTIKVSTTHSSAESTLTLDHADAAKNAVIELTKAQTRLQVKTNTTIAGLQGSAGSVNPNSSEQELNINTADGKSYTYGGTFNSGALRKSGAGTQIFTNSSITAANVTVDAGTLKFEKGLSSNIVVNGGVLEITGTHKGASISVAGGTLKFNDGTSTTTTNATAVNVSNSGVLELTKNTSFSAQAVQFSIAGGTIKNLVLSEDRSLVVRDKNSEIVGFTLNGGLLSVGNLPLALSGGIYITSGTVDFSEVVFSSQSVAVFSLANYTLNGSSIARDFDRLEVVGAEGSYSYDEATKQIFFKAAASYGVTDWTGASPEWTNSSFGGESFIPTQSVRFYDTTGEQNVRLIGAVTVKKVIVDAGTNGSYVLNGNSNSSLDITDTFNVQSGKFTVNVQTNSKGGIIVAGGTLVGRAENSLAGSVSLRSGTLSVEHVNALSEKDISISGGTLAFVSGALNDRNLNIISSSNTTPVTLKWLGSNNTNDISSQIKVSSGVTPVVIFDTEANEVVFRTAISVSGNYTKTGTGTLALGAPDGLRGTFTVDAGTLDLRANGGNSGVFVGDIIVNQGGRLVLSRANAFGSEDAATYTNSILVNAGGQLLIGPNEGGEDNHNQPFRGKTISLAGGTISGGTTRGFDLMGGVRIETLKDSGTSEIASRLQLRQSTTDFSIAENSTLLVTGEVAQSDTEATSQHTLNKTGTGKLILAGTATYTGETNINAGILQVGNGGNRGSLGSGTVKISSGAELQFNRTGTITVLGGIEGAGSLHVQSGNVTVNSKLAHTGGTIVDDGALLRLPTGVSHSGKVVLNGSLSGNFTGTVTLGERAALHADANEEFQFGASVDGYAGIRKTGEGTAILTSNFADKNFTYNVESGALLTNVQNTFASIVNLGNGAIGSGATSQGSWIIQTLNVGSEDQRAVQAEVRGNVTLSNGTENSINFFNGSSLRITTPATIQFTATGTTELVGSGALIIGGDQATATAKFEKLVVGQNFVTTGQGRADITVSQGSVLVLNEAEFGKAVLLLGTGSLKADGKLSFNNPGETSEIHGLQIQTSANNTVFDVIGGTLRLNEGVRFALGTDDNPAEIAKTGNGTLIVETRLAAYQGNVKVLGGNLRLTSTGGLEMSKDIFVSGNTSLLDLGSVLTAIRKESGSVILTSGAYLKGSLDLGTRTPAFDENQNPIDDVIKAGTVLISDATIQGNLAIRETGENSATLGNVKVERDLILGNGKYIFTGESGSISVTGGFTWAPSAEAQLSIANANAIGSEYVLVKYGNLDAVTVNLGNIKLADVSDGIREYRLENSGKELKVVAYGTYLWNINGPTKITDSGWTITGVDGNKINQAFAENQYLDIVYRGISPTGNKLEIDSATHIAGIIFNGKPMSPTSAVNNSSFTLDFKNKSGFADLQKTAGVTLEKSAVTIASGTTIFSGDFDNTFSGGLYVAAGANLDVQGQLDKTHRLGTGVISLAGTLRLNGDTNILENDFEIKGQDATIVVGKDAQILGKVSSDNATLTKEGTGTLTFSANSFSGDKTLNTLVIKSSGVVIGGDTTNPVQTLGISKIVLEEDTSLTLNADVALNKNGQTLLDIDNAIVYFKGETANLHGGLNLKAARLGFDSPSKNFVVGGAKTMSDDNKVLSVLNTVFSTDGTGTLSVVNGGLKLDGAKTAEDNVFTSLNINTADVNDTIEITRVLDGENSGEFNFIKSGEGKLNIAETFNSAADVYLRAGTISMKQGSAMTGNITVLGDSNLVISFNAIRATLGATLGATGKTLQVDSGKTFTIKTENFAATAEKVTIASNLQIAGTLQIDSANNTAVHFTGTEANYNFIALGSQNSIGALHLNDGVKISGLELRVYKDSSLNVDGAVSGNGGYLRVGDGAKIALTNANSKISFTSLNGLSQNSQLEMKVLGEGTLEFTGGISAENVSINIAEKAKVVFANNENTFVNFNELRGNGTFEKTGTGYLVIDNNSSKFTGTLSLTAGETEILGKGAMANAALNVKDKGVLKISIADAVIGKIGENAGIAKTLSGNGRVVVTNSNSLRFGENTLAGFTGTLVAEGANATLYYNKALSSATLNGVALIDGGILETEGSEALTLSKLIFEQNGNQGKIKVDAGETLSIQTTDSSALDKSYQLIADIGGNMTLNEVKSSQIEIVKGGSGTLTLTAGTAANEFQRVSINEGTLVSEGIDALGKGNISVNNGKLRINLKQQGNIENAIAGTGTLELALNEDPSNPSVVPQNAEFKALDENFGGEIIVGEKLNLVVTKEKGVLAGNNALKYVAQENASITFKASGDETRDNRASFAGSGNFIFETDKAIRIDNKHNELTGKVTLAKGTLWVGATGNLGTGEIVIDPANNATPAAELHLAGASLENKKISGKLLVNDSGNSFVRELAVERVDLAAGTLAVEKLSNEPTLSFTNGTLELGYSYNNGNFVTREDGSNIEFRGKFEIPTDALILSHAGENSSSSVDGSFVSALTDSSEIRLVGGGLGSELKIGIDKGSVVKMGHGKWILANHSSKGNIDVRGGTLAVAQYNGGTNAPVINIASSATFEIAGFSNASSTNPVVSGTISGDGTLLISHKRNEVKLDITREAGSTWNLALGDSAYLLVDANSRGSDTDIVLDKGSKLRFDVAAGTNLTYGNILIGGRAILDNAGNILDEGATVSKTGTGTLILTNERLGEFRGNLSIEAGRVEITEKGSFGSSIDGEISIAKNAELAINTNGESQIGKKISGQGTLVFKSGTRTGLYEQSSSFEGTVQIEAGAEVKLRGANTSAANFGNATVQVDGNLSTEFYTAGNLGKISGTGTLLVKNNQAKVESRFDSTAFTGTIQIETGTLTVNTETWEKMHNAVELKNENDSIFKLENKTGSDYTLSANNNQFSGIGKLKLSGNSFTLNAGNNLQLDNATLSVAENTSLNLGANAQINGSLEIAEGAKLIAVGNSNSRNISGTFFVLGDLELASSKDNLSNVFFTVGGNASIQGTGDINAPKKIVIDDSDGVLSSGGSLTLIQAAGKTEIGKGITFSTASDEYLQAYNDGHSIRLSVEAEDAFVTSSLRGLYDVLLTHKDSAIFQELNVSSTSAGEKTAMLSNFSSVSFGSILELGTGFANIEQDLLRERLEQRRYAYESLRNEGSIRPYVNTFGEFAETKENKDKSANYDINHYGASAGFDVSISKDLLLGLSFAYDRGNAKIHNNGGKHESDAASLGVYGMTMLNDVSYFGFGANLSFAGIDTKRTTAIGETLTGTGDSTSFALSATIGTIFAINDEFHFSPYFGLDYTLTESGKIRETGGTESALEIDSVSRSSLRASLGGTFNWIATEKLRIGLELAYHHEFLDTDKEIGAKFRSGTYANESFSSTAYFSGENSISIGPRAEYRFNDEWSASLSYTFEADFDNTATHSVNLGVNCRF